MTQDSTFDRKRHFYGAILGPLIAALIWFSPIQGLNSEQHHLLAIMSLVAVWWITEPVAIPVTSLTASFVSSVATARALLCH